MPVCYGIIPRLSNQSSYSLCTSDYVSSIQHNLFQPNSIISFLSYDHMITIFSTSSGEFSEWSNCCMCTLLLFLGYPSPTNQLHTFLSTCVNTPALLSSSKLNSVECDCLRLHVHIHNIYRIHPKVLETRLGSVCWIMYSSTAYTGLQHAVATAAACCDTIILSCLSNIVGVSSFSIAIFYNISYVYSWQKS